MRIIIDIIEGINEDKMVVDIEGLKTQYLPIIQKIGSIEQTFNSKIVKN